jgi:hypothetical protein
MSSIYFRFLNEDNFNDEGDLYFETDFSFIEHNGLWSDYHIQTPIVDILDRQGVIRDDDYILCILYGDLCKDIFTDIQFAVTETAKFREHDDLTFDRALGEELGLEMKRIPRKNYNTVNGISLTTYAVNINKTLVKAEHGHVLDTEISRERDNKKKKTAVAVFGSKKDICSHLNKPIVLDFSKDAIVGFAAVKFGDAKEYFYKNDTTHNKGWSDKEKKKRSRYFRH